MGGLIDRLFGWCAVCVILFGLALRLTDSVPISLLAVGTLALLLHTLLGRWSKGRRANRKRRLQQASAYLESVVLGGADEAILRGALPEGAVICFHLPEHQLSRDELYNQWRAHHGEKSLILAECGGISRGAALLAESLCQPAVQLISRKELIRRLAVDSVPLPVRERTGFAWKKARSRLLLILRQNRVETWRCLCYGGVMLFVYLLTGRALYLPFGLMLLGAGALGWHARRSAA